MQHFCRSTRLTSARTECSPISQRRLSNSRQRKSGRAAVQLRPFAIDHAGPPWSERCSAGRSHSAAQAHLFLDADGIDGLAASGSATPSASIATPSSPEAEGGFTTLEDSVESVFLWVSFWLILTYIRPPWNAMFRTQAAEHTFGTLRTHRSWLPWTPDALSQCGPVHTTEITCSGGSSMMHEHLAAAMDRLANDPAASGQPGVAPRLLRETEDVNFERHGGVAPPVALCQLSSSLIWGATESMAARSRRLLSMSQSTTRSCSSIRETSPSP